VAKEKEINKKLSANAIDGELNKLNIIFNKTYVSSCPVAYARKQNPQW